MIAGPPDADRELPAAVVEIARIHDATPVWRNEAGGITLRGHGVHIKWSPIGGPDLRREQERLIWAAPFTTVPEPLEHRSDGTGEWLVTRTVAGRSAVDPDWTLRASTAVPAIGRGLRELHEALPVDDCPFRWDLDLRLGEIDAGLGHRDPDDWGQEHRHLDFPAARRLLADPPPVDGPVVCHGDACAPNTLLDEDGTPVAHVDLGRLGTGDRWADLAIASLSCTWNYGPGFEELLVESYGVDWDPRRIAYYRLLWDLGP
ncbi:aminoglycoside 3'-phosphotransferase [Nakamurella alba]|uniref:aminoglycoside 3'-phosphotransferase n=1 Tax=Nakamurella alba TaxID=2665158 RepID=UPI002AC354F4|nr:aminoglycoside 3'-phosphotransferase [Nakamurella alba]